MSLLPFVIWLAVAGVLRSNEANEFVQLAVFFGGGVWAMVASHKLWEWQKAHEAAEREAANKSAQESFNAMAEKYGPYPGHGGH